MKQRRLVLLAAAVLSAASAPAVPADAPGTQQTDGLRSNRPATFALTGAKIVVSPDETIPSGTIVVRDRKVLQVGADVAPPAEAHVIDAAGKTVYPGLIDSFTEQEVSTEPLSSGTPYWNRQIRPQLSVAAAYKVDAALNGKFRKQGVTARLVAPEEGIVKGFGSVVLTGDDDPRAAIVRKDVTQHVRLTVSRGRDRKQYPNSPMGAVALARQAFYDAEWYQRAWQAAGRDASLPRPEFNDALEVLKDLAEDQTPIVVDTSNELFALRADRFAREFGLRLIVRGSGNEYRRLEAIRATGRPVIVPVAFPKPPNVATDEAALDASLETLMHWDHAAENPARLAQAGVTFALCSYRLDEKQGFLKAVRQAVERGLDPQAALAALTTTPAELFGVSDQIGSLEPGRIANLLVTDGPLFENETRLLETWVAGKRFELESPTQRTPRGTWELAIAESEKHPRQMLLEIDGSRKLSAKLRVPPADEETSGDGPADSGSPTTVGASRVALNGAHLSALFPADELETPGILRLTLVLDEADSASGLGSVVWPDGVRTAVTARKTDATEAPADDVDDEEDAAPSEDSPSDAVPAKRPAQPKGASFPVNFPLGAFGRSGPPETPAKVAFTNATVWTCGPQGVLKNATVLIGDGRILDVGRMLKIPPDAVVVEAKGMHVTPGIIDCHSHMATDGGINESAQAVTAEVRIGDFVDCDDVTIYRQLAGGVTCANILHGSANPVGGQNQVIKLRWGALAEEMKFAEAPAGIKFALGENVKQSNWGDDYTTRYPQTRMGVEQVYRDAFQAARQYADRWNDWRQHRRGLPPRRDLELDALAEVLQRKRWIHCHSYRQDEILALLRLLDEHGITIGTLQHILEGYKVADAMRAHGAMGSAFSDWWAYKFEVYDAIPFGGALMHQAGVVVSFNSDDRELARHLNHEAAKAVKYGGVTPDEALKFVTLNPARQLRIDQFVGSLEAGKHADLVLWSGPPLSNFSRCEQTWIDGRKYFDRADDRQAREKVKEMRNSLIQKILVSGTEMRPRGEGDGDPAELWPREDLFCHHHHGDDDHDENHAP